MEAKVVIYHFKSTVYCKKEYLFVEFTKILCWAFLICRLEICRNGESENSLAFRRESLLLVFVRMIFLQSVFMKYLVMFMPG